MGQLMSFPKSMRVYFQQEDDDEEEEFAERRAYMYLELGIP